MNTIKVALPKGRLMSETSKMLDGASWEMNDYREGTRSYRLGSGRFPEIQAKIFQEKDIPIQVAVGNYDLGICGFDWVAELTAKYPSSSLIRLRDLKYGSGAIYAVAGSGFGSNGLSSIQSSKGTVRMVSEYPNLAESFALRLRLPRFSVFPLWGAPDAYPPDSADLALMSVMDGAPMVNHGLTTVSTVTRFSACLIANRSSWESKDLSGVLASLDTAVDKRSPTTSPVIPTSASENAVSERIQGSPGMLRLALPDGHQQTHAVGLLRLADIEIADYPSSTGNRRPVAKGIPGLQIKVIRPQDMPMQVAAGNFDLAITGRDWLRDHLFQFPSSPVKELLDLRFGKVRIVAVVCNDVPVSHSYELRDLWASRNDPIRIAAEYTNIADRYAHDNHFGRYKIIPTWGATEAFLPEDADLLIENTETGSTIARHNLKIIDTLFESTGQLIGNAATIETSPDKQRTADLLVETLRRAVEGK